MDKYFVTHSKAVALKELGFDMPCFRYIYTGDTGNNVDRYEEVELSKAINFNHDSLCISQPLKSQVFEWFREKHELVANWLYDQHDNYGSYIGVSIKNVHFKETIVGVYKIYEEAESACIDKLIELCNDK